MPDQAGPPLTALQEAWLEPPIRWWSKRCFWFGQTVCSFLMKANLQVFLPYLIKHDRHLDNTPPPPPTTWDSINFHHMSHRCWHFIYSTLLGFTSNQLMTSGDMVNLPNRHVRKVDVASSWGKFTVKTMQSGFMEMRPRRRQEAEFSKWNRKLCIWLPSHELGDEECFRFCAFFYLVEPTALEIDHCSICCGCLNHHPSKVLIR